MYWYLLDLLILVRNFCSVDFCCGVIQDAGLRRRMAMKWSESTKIQQVYRDVPRCTEYTGYSFNTFVRRSCGPQSGLDSTNQRTLQVSRNYKDVHLSALHSRGKEIFIGGIFIFGLLRTADSALAQRVAFVEKSWVSCSKFCLRTAISRSKIWIHQSFARIIHAVCSHCSACRPTPAKMACFGAGAVSLSAAATKPLLAMIFPGPDGFHMLTRLTYGLLMKYWLHLVAFGCIWLHMVANFKPSNLESEMVDLGHQELSALWSALVM